MRNIDVLIVGGGPAGLAAALELNKKGVRDILIVERERQAGGILRQCIHDGFGLTRFGESISGPEYAKRFTDEVQKRGIELLSNATVYAISPEKRVTVVTREGILHYQAKAVVLAMGCRERTQGALAIPGERPAGVFTAGVAQAYINLYNRMPAKNAIILGSGDIGMIMARRLTLEGAKVIGVFEIAPYAAGLPRNVEQCLNDYHIPLYLSHTVTEIHGGSCLTGVTISEVNAHFQPIAGTGKYHECDTLILSVGLIPENELSREAGVVLHPGTRGAVVDESFQTNVPGIFAAGNVLHVHDLVDFVSLEAERLADAVAEYLEAGELPECNLEIGLAPQINHTVPMKVSGMKDFDLSLRVSRPMKEVRIVVRQGGREVAAKKMVKAIPAEMIRIPIKAGRLEREGRLEVSVE